MELVIPLSREDEPLFRQVCLVAAVEFSWETAYKAYDGVVPANRCAL